MATTGVVDGHDMRWFIAGTAVTEATTGSIEFTAETRKSTSKDSTGGWSVIKVGEKSFTGSCEALFTEAGSYESFFAAFSAGTSLVMEFTTGVSGDLYDNCVCFITALSKSSDDNQDVTYSISFEGSGVPSRDTEV